jgi:hypothetical protein
MAQIQRQIDPRILQAAQHDGTLRHMIQLGGPLTRDRWIRMSYLGHPPHPWTAEHEEEVPEPFRKQLYND